ncbi:MAG: fatty acid desaturase [Planctomycetes bacterium]|nr:fatty acid desaturase [Planctomycetota bacterium]
MNDTRSPIPSLRELGTDLLVVTPLRRLLTLAYPFLWCVAYFVFAVFDYWLLAVGCLVVLSFVTYGSTSHDLVHRNLGLSRRTNDWLLCIIELLTIRSGHAYQAAHLHHHARFPAVDDIESTAARRSFLGAIVEGFAFQTRIWLWALRNAEHKRPWIICEVAAGFAIMAVAVIALPFSPIPLIYVALMKMGTWIIPLATSYLPHDPQGADELSHTRAFRGMVASIVAVQHLYHLEHHLFPAVPHANWPLLAKRLDPHLAKAGVKPVVFWF